MLPQFCRSLTVGLVHAELQEQVVDVGVGVLRRADDGDLAGQRGGAAEPVDLARVGRAHQPQQQVVAGGRVGGQVAGLEVQPARGAAAQHRAADAGAVVVSHRRVLRRVLLVGRRTRCRGRPAARAGRSGRGPSSPSWKAARLAASLSTRACDAVSARRDVAARHQHARRRRRPPPRRPGRTVCPPSTTGTLTAPAVAFTVPCALTARDQTGNRISRRSATSRTPQPSTTPRTPRRWSAVANSSPNSPSVDGEFVATTRTSPGRHCSTATWIIRLSPGPAQHRHRGAADARARPGGPELGAEVADPAQRLVHGRHAVARRGSRRRRRRRAADRSPPRSSWAGLPARWSC